MVRMPKDVMDLLKAAPDPSISKAIATVNDEGVPNITPMGSITAVDDETISFMDGALLKTRENLERGKNKKIAFIVIKQAQPITAYQIKGTFIGFQTSGPIYENWAKSMKARGYPPPRAIGLAKVDEVYSATPGAGSKKLA